ncbi:hypothetical protein HY227_00910 [Candidatus Wolfebacteria bacterium]|nr:hypothetical protein [Candidatus Wolfebacteria bacterium]
MKKRIVLVYLTGVIGAVLIIFWSWTFQIDKGLIPDFVSAATSSNVTVSATVVATVSCLSNPGTTDFGTLAAGSITTASPNVSSSMTCSNSGTGCAMTVADAGGGGNPGLWNSVASALVPSPASGYPATTTLTAGTEGYGVQATTTGAGSGGTMGVASRYVQSGNAVGGLLIAGTTLASSTAAITGREVVTTHKAAISASTMSGSYSDTTTYSCTGN